MKLLRSGHGITALLRKKSWNIHCRAVKKMRETAKQKILNIKHITRSQERTMNTNPILASATKAIRLKLFHKPQCPLNVKLRSVISAGFKDRAKRPVLKGCMASLNTETTKSKFHPTGESTIAEKPLAILKNVILTNPTHGTALTLLSTPL